METTVHDLMTECVKLNTVREASDTLAVCHRLERRIDQLIISGYLGLPTRMDCKKLPLPELARICSMLAAARNMVEHNREVMTGFLNGLSDADRANLTITTESAAGYETLSERLRLLIMRLRDQAREHTSTLT